MSKASEVKCARCQHRRPRHICGCAESPNFEREMDLGDSCEHFVLNPAQQAFTRALVLSVKGSPEESMREAKTALQGNVPEDDEIALRALLGNKIFELRGVEDRAAFDEAVGEIEQSLRIDARGGYHFFEERVLRQANLERLQLAYAYFATKLDEDGRRVAAIAYLEEKLALLDHIPGTHMPMLHNILGRLYEESGQRDRARGEFQKALESESLGESDADERDIAARSLNVLRSSTSGKSGCFIATSVYGSDDCPEVRILRRYRDEVLLGHVLGRILVHLYAISSPLVAGMLDAVPVVKPLVRDCLVGPVVCRADRGVRARFSRTRECGEE